MHRSTFSFTRFLTGNLDLPTGFWPVSFGRVGCADHLSNRSQLLSALFIQTASVPVHRQASGLMVRVGRARPDSSLCTSARPARTYVLARPTERLKRREQSTLQWILAGCRSDQKCALGPMFISIPTYSKSTSCSTMIRFE